MVIERERRSATSTERLREANECHDRSIASLDAVAARLEEMQAQARGQATRIRMKALREAVEVSRRVEALTERRPSADGESSPQPRQRQRPGRDLGVFAGKIKIEIGPLGDFSQLVGFEDASAGSAPPNLGRTLLGGPRDPLDAARQPVDLLRELEGLSGLDFKVRHTAPDNLILDLSRTAAPSATPPSPALAINSRLILGL